MGIPYVIVKNKARLGTVVHKKKAAILTLQDVRSEDNAELAKLVSAAKANFTDKYESARREWGGGKRGNKSTHMLQRRAKAAGALLSLRRCGGLCGRLDVFADTSNAAPKLCSRHHCCRP